MNYAKLTLLRARLAWWRRRYAYRHRRLAEYAAKVKNNREHFPGHKQALREAEEGEHKWGRLEGQAARECHALAEAIHKLAPPSPVPSGEGVCVPKTSWNPYRKRLASWIARELYDAVAHGAHGVVTSGLRTFAEQRVLYERYRHGGNVAARPGSSNHEGWDYRQHKGAVDWSQPESLWSALNRKRSHKLIWAEHVGLADTVHFSATGRLHDGFPGYEERRAHSSRW
jgi:hypothetical protein